MGATKDRILEASLHLFARDGYEAVSIGAIAGELGMAKSALYKHFPDKRAVFDSLVDDMLKRHKAAGAKQGLATESIGDAAHVYAAATPDEMAALGETLFRYWTEDDSAVAFRRMLSLERFRNERVAAIYDELFLSGQLDFHEAMFAEMIRIGALRPGDAMQMALEFWSPIYLLMQATDHGMGTNEATAAIRTHVVTFAATHDGNANESVP